MDTTFNSKDLIKQLVKEQHFTSTTDVMNCMKEMFADVLQETLNAEMDDYLGFDKSQRRADSSQEKNYRNGSTKRTLKTQLGEVQINLALLGNIKEMLMVLKKEYYPFMQQVCP